MAAHRFRITSCRLLCPDGDHLCMHMVQSGHHISWSRPHLSCHCLLCPAVLCCALVLEQQSLDIMRRDWSSLTDMFPFDSVCCTRCKHGLDLMVFVLLLLFSASAVQVLEQKGLDIVRRDW